jgi:hypothetical protein
MIFREYSGALHLTYNSGGYFYKYGGALHQRQKKALTILFKVQRI